MFSSLCKDSTKIIQQTCQNRPPVFKIWWTNELYIFNSQPDDIEILMTTFLEKNNNHFYNFLNKSVFTLPELRREMNRTFNSKILASSHKVFVKHAKETVKTFEGLCGTEQTELLFGLWKHNLDIAIETLMDITPASVEGLDDLISLIIRAEKLQSKYISQGWSFINFFTRKEAEGIKRSVAAIGKKIVRINKQQVSTNSAYNDNFRKKCFLNHIIDWSESSNKMTELDLAQETVTMAIAASETTSLATVSVILALGLLSDVQEKVYEEISSLLTDNEDPTIYDIIRMDYLERVIKETLRLLPVIPVITRSIDKTIKLGSTVYPAGSNLAIPLAYLHRRPDIWPDPLKFDPDRFLPKEVARRHRCAYVPFSYGPRNCIGPKYAMMSMKIALAYIVKNFKIKALNYGSLEDLEFDDCHFFAKAKGYRVMFERRTGSNILKKSVKRCLRFVV